MECGFFGNGLYIGSAPLPYFDGGNANSQTGTPSWEGTSGKSVSKLSLASNLLTTDIDVTGTGATDGGIVRHAVAAGPANIILKYSETYASDQYSATYVQPVVFNLDPPGVPIGTLTTDDDQGTITVSVTTGAGADLTITDSGTGDTFTITTSDAGNHDRR